MRRRWSALPLSSCILLACSSDTSSSGTPGILAAGAVEMMAPASGWTTLGSFTGAAVTGHLWGATRSEYEFHAQPSTLRETSSGFEVLAWGANTTQQQDQHHLVRFAFEASGRAQKAELYTTFSDSYFPRGVHILKTGRIWMWRGDAYQTSTEIYHADMEKPYLDISPYYQRGQRLSVSATSPEVFALLDQNELPWFTFQNKVFTPLNINEVDPVGNTVAVKAFNCEQCTYFNQTSGGLQGSVPFLSDGKLYWPAYGQKSSGAIAPARLAIFTPNLAQSGKTNHITFYNEELVTKFDDVPINFDDYSWLRSPVIGGVAHLTWIGADKASQLLYDPKTKALTTRFKEVSVTGLTIGKVKDLQFDESGDLYLLIAEGSDAVVKKLSPSGLSPVGGPIVFSSEKPSSAKGAWVASAEALFLYKNKPLVLVVGNSFPRVEPQLSLIVPK